MKKLLLIKNRSDIGAGTRGADMGIDAMEIAAINANNDFFHQQEHVDVATHNESIYLKNTNPFAKRIGHVFDQCERISIAVEKALKAEKFPLVLSGDHSSALGTISGIKAAFPEKKLGVIWIDAHADLHSPYTSPSGNIHGMPLAAALGFDHREEWQNPIEPVTRQYWELMKNLGTDGPKMLPQHLVYFGLRDFEAAEKDCIDRYQIRTYRVEELRYRGLEICVKETLESLESCDMLYISFDVDSMDCDRISYGTGTPVPTGLYPEEIMGIMHLLMATHKVVCIEFAEINPLLDNKGNLMAETAFRVLENVVSNTLNVQR